MSEKWKVIFKELKKEDFSDLNSFVTAAQRNGLSKAEINSGINEIKNSKYSVLREIKCDGIPINSYKPRP